MNMPRGMDNISMFCVKVTTQPVLQQNQSREVWTRCDGCKGCVCVFIASNPLNKTENCTLQTWWRVALKKQITATSEKQKLAKYSDWKK